MDLIRERLAELETRAAFQEKQLSDLNDVVVSQQRDIERLRQEVRTLRQQLSVVAPSLVANASDETPPPHY